MSNRRKAKPVRGRIAPGLFLLPPIGELLDAGHGVPLCDCGNELEYVGDFYGGDFYGPADLPPAAGSLDGRL